MVTKLEESLYIKPCQKVVKKKLGKKNEQEIKGDKETIDEFTNSKFSVSQRTIQEEGSD